MKIVGVGFNKTGTKTLGVCLRHWGLKHMTFNKKVINYWRNGDYASLMQIVDDFDSFEDWPWPLIYEQIDAAFPGSKFILTRRKDSETWFTSLCNHADRTGPTVYREYVYGHSMPHKHKKEHIEVYERHIHSVRKYFEGRPNDLLEVCWEEGDGWAELSTFLGQMSPGIAFPHMGRSER